MFINEDDCTGPEHFTPTIQKKKEGNPDKTTGHYGPIVVTNIIIGGTSAFFEPLPEGVTRIIVLYEETPIPKVKLDVSDLTALQSRP